MLTKYDKLQVKTLKLQEINAELLELCREAKKVINEIGHEECAECLHHTGFTENSVSLVYKLQQGINNAEK